MIIRRALQRHNHSYRYSPYTLTDQTPTKAIFALHITAR
jgi:hypothetical protein